MNLTPFETFYEKCDQLWAMYIRLKYPVCYFPMCGKKTEEACHTIKRRHLATRWAPENGLGGCQFHNRWEEDHLEEARRMKENMLGQWGYKKLRQRAEQNQNWKPTLEELEAIAKTLEDAIRVLGKSDIKLRSYKLERRKRAKMTRDQSLEKFRAAHEGLSPSQVAYRKRKAHYASKRIHNPDQNGCDACCSDILDAGMKTNYT